MENWRGAWFFVKSELAWARWKILFPLLFAAYMLLFMVPLFNEALDGDDRFFSYMGIDLYALLLFPLLGLMATQPYFSWKSDIYTKKLEIWRTLPIPFRQIALGKYLLYLAIGIPAMIIFFTGFYFAIRSIGSHPIELGSYLQFALFWISYSMIIGYVYLYVELGFKKKIYFWFCVIISIVVLVALIAFSILLQQSLLLNSYLTIKNGGWWLTATAIAIAALVIPFGLRSIERRLSIRNLAK